MSTLPTVDSELVFDNKEKYYTWLAKERGKGYRPIPIFAGSFSDGTRYTVLDQSQSPVFCLVQDLTAPERRVGQVSVTIANASGRGNATQTLSPALLDTNLNNYRCFSGVDDTGQAWAGNAKLNSISQVAIQVFRLPNGTASTSSASTGVTVGAGDLTNILVLPTDPGGGNDPHGADAGFGGHGHTSTGHPVTDPQHIHPGGIPTFGTALTVKVDWLIWHI